MVKLKRVNRIRKSLIFYNTFRRKSVLKPLNLTFEGSFKISKAERVLFGLKPVPVFLKKSKNSLPSKGIGKSLTNHLVGFTNSKISSKGGKGKPIPSREPLTGTEKRNPLLETLKNSSKLFCQSLQWRAKFEAIQSTERFLSGRFSILQTNARREAAGFSFKESKERSQAKTSLEREHSNSVKRPTPAPTSRTEFPSM